MRVRELMHRDVVTVGTEATIVAASGVMRAKGISSVMVVGPDGKLGILTERDCVTLRAAGADPSVASVPDHMLTVEHDIRHVPVVERGQLVGMVSLRDPMGRRPALERVDEKRRQSLRAHRVRST